MTRPDTDEINQQRIARDTQQPKSALTAIALGQDEAGGPVVRKASFLRTARKIMDGTVYVSPDKVHPQ